MGATLAPTMRQVHRAGEKAFVDFSGQRPAIVDIATGELVLVELFVGALGASSYVYAEAPRWAAPTVFMVELDNAANPSMSYLKAWFLLSGSVTLGTTDPDMVLPAPAARR